MSSVNRHDGLDRNPTDRAPLVIIVHGTLRAQHEVTAWSQNHRSFPVSACDALSKICDRLLAVVSWFRSVCVKPHGHVPHPVTLVPLPAAFARALMQHIGQHDELTLECLDGRPTLFELLPQAHCAGLLSAALQEGGQDGTTCRDGHSVKEGV